MEGVGWRLKVRGMRKEGNQERSTSSARSEWNKDEWVPDVPNPNRPSTNERRGPRDRREDLEPVEEAGGGAPPALAKGPRERVGVHSPRSGGQSSASGGGDSAAPSAPLLPTLCPQSHSHHSTNREKQKKEASRGRDEGGNVPERDLGCEF